MNIRSSLAQALDPAVVDILLEFAVKQNWLPEVSILKSERFLNRSVVPHLKKFLALFNREGAERFDPVTSNYWKSSSHRDNLALAYYLVFMPLNAIRLAGIFDELDRLGWKESPRSIVDWGCGPGSSVFGVSLAQKAGVLSHWGSTLNWSLVDQDYKLSRVAHEWAEHLFQNFGLSGWTSKPEHQGLEASPVKTADLWIFNYVLNELDQTPEELAQNLISRAKKSLSSEGTVIIVEPAMRAFSRKLLAIRKAILESKENDFQVLLPCLGHQACGALAVEKDWCHEEVLWDRPAYLRGLDKLCRVDHRRLAMSYLVLTRSKRKREEILPKLGTFEPDKRYRVVSSCMTRGRDHEFYLCGSTGKQRCRYRAAAKMKRKERAVERGDILAEVGDPVKVQELIRLG